MTWLLISFYALVFGGIMFFAARRSLLWASAAALGLGVVFFVAVFPGADLGLFSIPGIAQLVTGSESPLPVPRFAFWTYLILIAIGILLVASATQDSLDELVTPIRQWFAGDVGDLARRVRVPVLFGLLPLVVAAVIFSSMMPATDPPVRGRQAHPSIAYDENLTNPYREGASEETRDKMTHEGRHLYAKNCSPCHGGKADGTGYMARALGLPPANFTDVGTIATLVEGYAFKRIEDGGIGLPGAGTPWDSAMPRWKGELSNEEIFRILLAEYDLAGVMPRVPEKLE